MHKVDQRSFPRTSPDHIIARRRMSDNFLGIDVAKSKFDVALLGQDGKVRHRTFPNKPEGFSAVRQWLSRQGVEQVQACLEATGTYGLALATHLHQAGLTVSVVNPACIKAFAESELRRTKTDRVDAAVIARFCRALQPAPWQPPSPELAGLQALVRRLESLRQLHTQERNRLSVPGLAEAVRASLTRVLGALEDEIKRIEEQISDHIDQHPGLREKRDLLESIPGIGQATAHTLLSEMAATSFQSARQLAAYAGLVPQERRSGASVRGKARLSKRGNARLRKGLYWPAVVAMRANPPLRAFAQRLRAAGKPTMVIIGALMRKLLHLAFGVLKSGRAFDPNYQASMP